MYNVRNMRNPFWRNLLGSAGGGGRFVSFTKKDVWLFKSI